MNKYLLSLLHLTDPSLPIGGFAHSAGLETYVQKGIVHDAVTAKDFIIRMIENNIRHNDAAMLTLSYHAAKQKNLERIIELDNFCNAIKLPEEIRTASGKLGIRLHKILSANYSAPLIISYSNQLDLKNIYGHYSVAFGMYANLLEIPLSEALTGFYYNTVAGLVNNCIKLIPLGQQQGQEILFALHPNIESLVINTMEPDVKMLGRSCIGFDIRGMQHERLYSRLYMS